MATENPDPNRQSAGGSAGAGGNNFQSRVAAWWLGQALLQVHGRGMPFGFPHHVLPTRVAAQTGTATDDVRISFDDGSNIYAQCKTSLSVSTDWPLSEGKKNEFAATWVQFYRQIDSGAATESLALVLVVTQASGPIRNLQRVLDRFRMSPAGTALNSTTVAVTKDEQAVATKLLKLFNAFSQDRGLPSFAQHQDRLLRHAYVQVLQVGDGERDWMDLDALLQFGVLSSPSDAPLAMRVLSDLGHGLHEDRTSLDHLEVRKALSDVNVALKDALDLRTEWSELEERGKTAQEGVFDTLGREFRLIRAEEVSSLQTMSEEHRCVVVLGPSGSGKSVVVKNWARGSLPETRRIVWLSGAELDGFSPTELSQRLGLRVSVNVLFRTETRPAYLIIDGLDRCFTGEGLACIQQLLAACRMADPESSWHLVMTCDELEWERVIRTFQASHASLPQAEPLRITPVSTKEARPLLEKFPLLAKLAGQREVWGLFKNLKILDLVVTRLENGAAVDASGWVSELQVCEWWWQKDVSDNPDNVRRAAALLELAQKQGDESRASIRLTELSGESREVAGALRENRCWKLVDGNRLDFAHDLFGEWSRYQVLRSEAAASQDFCAFLKARAILPLWHRAIRLYAAELLETDEGVAKWQELLRLATGESAESLLVGDLLLEGIAFSSRLETVTEILWPALSANGGELLRRFLNRFLHAATAPDPAALRQFSKKPELAVFAAAYRRYPTWIRWRALLPVLAVHAQFVAKAAPLEIAKMAEIWFRYTENGALGRGEMAELAVTAAEDISFQEEHDYSRREEPRVERAYVAALLAYFEQPKRVEDLALQLSGCKERKIKPKEEKLVPVSQRWQRPSKWRRLIRRIKIMLRIRLTDREESDAMIEHYSSLGTAPIGISRPTSEKPQPWPEGPSYAVSSEFQRAFLTTDASVTMIKENPVLARKILLASLIEEPRNISPFDSFASSMPDEHAGLTRARLFDSPFYDRAPFLSFLRVQPEAGLDTLIRFINFASERWSEEIRTHIQYDAPSATVQINGTERDWFGDWRLYYGYRGASWISELLGCALMALERWLYELVEEGEDLSPTLAMLLESSRSVGIAGVLVSLGKQDPQLFLGVLSPLIGVPIFHLWEVQKNGQFLSGPIPDIGAPQAEFARYEEWSRLPFRKQTLLEICFHLFATSGIAREKLGEAAARWSTQLEKLPVEDRSKGFVPQLLEFFDRNHWTAGKNDAGEEVWVYAPPIANAGDESVQPVEDTSAGESFSDALPLFGVPENCLRCLIGEDDALSSVPDDLWRMLKRFTRSEKDAGITEIYQNAGITFPLISVLLVRCSDWLRARPEARQLCEHAILEAPHPEVPPTGDQQALAGNTAPEVFYAAGLMALWAEQPESVDLRSRVVRFMAVAMDGGITSLFFQAFRYRNTLGEGFRQMQTLAVYAASERSRQRYIRAFRDSPKRFHDWIAKESVALAEARDREFPADWSRIRHKQFPMPHSNSSRYSRSTDRLHYGIDFEYLVAAFSWIPSLDEAESSDERQHWIRLRFHLLQVLLETFPPRQEREDHYEGTPYLAERKLLATTACLILQLRPDENPARFWKPIFDLGTPAQYWVEEFITDFFGSARESSVAPPQFVALWSEMIDFAEQSPAWRLEAGWGGLDRERLWLRLLGIDSLIQDDWEKHQVTIMEMWPRLRKAIESQIRDGESIPELCRFLRQPYAAQFLGDGLRFLDRLCNSRPDEVFDRIELEQAFASFLVSIRESPAVQGNPASEISKSYRSLVGLLASRQNAVALQLMVDHR